ncbi:PepSY domain-containing protein [Cesiribacter sp. SM1]|uniref:PepSY-associated TM helix domain-containing protein n=1 Tax=Cesiribacter sp. SM1 TaxID=2861196 RepID=UPI001CD202B7|nr:PepSY-associated TM helix domain-containing protein [Cesiribacter sp. SM1]
MKEKYSLRKLFNDLHLWMGIGSGIILFVVCLTGTLYTFRTEVEEALEPSKYHVTAPAQAVRLTPEEVLEKFKAKQEGKITAIEVPHDRSRAYQVIVKKSAEDRRGTPYYVNPYTAEILGTSKGPATDFFMGVFKLHRWLLLDTELGRPIVGGATIVFVFLILSGLVLWWPKKLKNWKQGFKIKATGNWKRINHDLHNSLGFYSFLLLLLMALTGLCWSFEWYKDGLGNVIGTEVFGGRGGKPVAIAPPAEAAEPFTLSELLILADSELPYEGNYRIIPAEDSSAMVVLNKYKTGFFALAATDKVQINQYTGDVLKVERFADKPLNEQIASSIKPLHTGEIFGTFSKILYFIACLIGTSLPVTGTIIWINKLRKGSKKTKKETAQKAVLAR